MEKRSESVFSTRIRAGKKRTYFFDVRTTRSNDYFVTITESRRRIGEDGFEKNKIFLYKEDFNKFIKSLEETINHVKKELLPNFDFDSFNHENNEEEDFDNMQQSIQKQSPTEDISPTNSINTSSQVDTDVEKW